MGGTSFDICLVRDGRPQIKTDWNWRYRYYIGLPMVDVQSVGAGGGSIARVRQGALLVGPESAGSTPGPVCYGRGGDAADRHRRRRRARLPPRRRVRGRAHASRRRRRARPRSARDVAEPLGVDVVDAAWGIERIVNANMANATRKVLAGHGADPRDLSLIAYGGNGAVHACAIARELGIDRILVPKAAPAFSALGVLVADYVVDLVRSYVTPLSQVDLGRRARADVRARRGGRQGARAGRPRRGRDRRPTLYVQMCYPGQNFDMSVPVPEGVALDEARPARPGRAVPRPARGRARLLLPLASSRSCAACASSRAAARRSPTTSPRPARSTTPAQARKGTRARVLGRRLGSTRRSTTARARSRAPRSTDPR